LHNKQLDQHHNEMLQINFNMTLPRLSCAFASVDVSDLLGTHRVNVSKNIRKFRLDANGERMGEVSAEIAVPHTEVVGANEAAALEEMSGGSVELGTKSLDNFIKNHDLVLINYYAPWCHWSRALAPVWEKTAKVLAADDVEQQYRIALGRADCTKRESEGACRQQHIAAFPSVIVYKDGHTVSHEHYHGDRTSDAFMQYIQTAARSLHPANRALQGNAPKPTHSAQGCLVSGFVEVRKVPGNFHVEAHSTRHSFDHQALDLSHSVQKLSFGPPLSRKEQYRVPRSSRPLMDRLKGKVFTSDLVNATYEHYIKVRAFVSSIDPPPSRARTTRVVLRATGSRVSTPLSLSLSPSTPSYLKLILYLGCLDNVRISVRQRRVLQIHRFVEQFH